jgi:hypothetical protein
MIGHVVTEPTFLIDPFLGISTYIISFSVDTVRDILAVKIA